MAFTPEPYNPQDTEDNLVCFACGTQFPEKSLKDRATCFICDDPRQFVPPTGQSFITLKTMRNGSQQHQRYHNEFRPLAQDGRVTSITTVPKFAIGQRAILVRNDKTGKNVLWDCITLLDEQTVDTIRGMGGLEAIVISHPHYYSTHVEWARAFGCPVYLAVEDKQWVCQDSAHQIWVDEVETEILKPADDGSGGFKAIKLGGHFPGSLVGLFDEKRLLIADTIVTTPAGMGDWTLDGAGETRPKTSIDGTGRPEGMNGFAFLWSIPNMIPLGTEEIVRMWEVLKEYDFVSTHGAFVGMDLEGRDGVMKGKVLESIKFYVKRMGGPEQEFTKTIL